jgi:hypothetical protein
MGYNGERRNITTFSEYIGDERVVFYPVIETLEAFGAKVQEENDRYIIHVGDKKYILEQNEHPLYDGDAVTLYDTKMSEQNLLLIPPGSYGSPTRKDGDVYVNDATITHVFTQMGLEGYLDEIDVMISEANDLALPNEGPIYESNIKQVHAGKSIWIGIRNKSVFFYSTRSNFKYKNYLCVFTDGKIEKLKRFNQNIRIVALKGDYLYYWKLGGSKEDILLQYNILDHSEQQIFKGKDLKRNLIFANEDNLYIPVEIEKKAKYILIQKDKIGIVETDPFYPIGEYNYYATAGEPAYGESALAEHIFSSYKSEAPVEIKLGPADHRILLKCGDGLIVHNDGNQEILYYIDQDNGLKELMSVECMASYSSIAVISDTAYISVKRFEGWGSMGKGMARFSNDTIEGTYKVEPSTFVVQKISDAVYETMYVYDETHIIGCDENMQVWFFDLDSGNAKLLF